MAESLGGLVMRLNLSAVFASILIACAPGVPVSAQSAAAQYPAEAFAALPGILQPKLSPNGSRLATRISKDGAVYLMVLPIDGSAPALISTRGSDLNWWKWVNDDWLIVGIGDKRPFADDEAYVTRALGVSADGKTINPLLDRLKDMGQQGDDVIWTAHDGSPRVLVSVQRSIYSD
ncbi:MAG: S9 family peptidase, partial [Sphingomonas sp.]|nr:S9 family peptidase [Sphingomonas sp.]